MIELGTITLRSPRREDDGPAWLGRGDIEFVCAACGWRAMTMRDMPIAQTMADDALNYIDDLTPRALGAR